MASPFDDAEARRTLRFLVSAAAEVLGHDDVVGGQAVGQAYLYDFERANAHFPLQEMIASLVSADLPIERSEMPYDKAIAYFTEKHRGHSTALLRSRVQDAVSVHTMKYDGTTIVRLALAPLKARTSSLAGAPVRVLETGPTSFLVVYSSGPACVQSPTLSRAMAEHRRWGGTLGVQSVGALNELQVVGRELTDFALHAEFRQEATLAALATAVHARCAPSFEGSRVGVVCIAGPTSSGKTTFATKLAMYLRNLGHVSKPLTVDHYYLPLDRQPRYKKRKLRSDVDYDAVESMDSALVAEHINALLSGKEVLTPRYDMKSGYRVEPGTPFSLPAGGLLIIEGIHALNPDFLRAVPRERLFRVYISPLSALQVDECNALKTTDHRLLRRMSRDYLFRGHSASRTLSMWANVRRGEHTWIFPHQDEVDFVVNSAMEFEMRVLKPLVEPLLAAVQPDDGQYAKARELLALLALFSPAPAAIVPPTSVMREFIGDGAFDCH